MDHLDHDPVRIGEIKRTRPVAMSFDFANDLGAVLLNPGVPLIDGFGRGKRKPKMVEQLGGGFSRRTRNPMDRQIVQATAGEIDVLGVGLPFELHLKDIHIEFLGCLRVTNLDSRVPEPECFHNGFIPENVIIRKPR